MALPSTALVPPWAYGRSYDQNRNKSEGMLRAGEAAVKARVAPVAADLNDNLKPDCAGAPVESVIPRIKAICQDHEINFSDEHLRARAADLMAGRTVSF